MRVNGSPVHIQDTPQTAFLLVGLTAAVMQQIRHQVAPSLGCVMAEGGEEALAVESVSFKYWNGFFSPESRNVMKKKTRFVISLFSFLNSCM